MSTAFIKFAMMLIEYFISKNKDNMRLHAAFVSLAKELRDAGIADVQTRLDAESQIEAGNEEWDKRDKSNNNGGGTSV